MQQEEIKEKLSAAFPGEVIQAATDHRGQSAVTVAAEKIRDVCEFLKKDPDLAFDFLSFVGGVDWHPKKPRFEIVYQLYSLKKNHRFRIKAFIDESENFRAAIDSVVSIWPTAEWHERETAEMFGVVFNGHPDPRKLLLPENWEIHPLRKDFPLLGNEEDTPDLPRPRS
jgi:NADH-quinone oxidoreductase subunit C